MLVDAGEAAQLEEPVLAGDGCDRGGGWAVPQGPADAMEPLAQILLLRAEAVFPMKRVPEGSLADACGPRDLADTNAFAGMRPEKLAGAVDDVTGRTHRLVFMIVKSKRYS